MQLKHVLLAVTGHGLGHLGQTIEAARALREAWPGLRLTVRSALPSERVRERFGFAVECLPADDDFGVRTRGGFDVDLPATRAAYEDLHRRWPAVLGAACDQIGAAKPDLVLANVGHVPLAAATRLGIPAFGLASLDWHTILKAYPETRGPAVLDPIASAYRDARALFELAPTSADAPWRDRVPVGPTAEKGTARRAELGRQLGASPSDRVVLCAFGGGAPPPPPTDWAACPETVFVAPRSWAGPPTVRPLDTLAWPFVDLVASCDACLTKLGYGIAAEAVRNGAPLIYHRRPGWAEDAVLSPWVERHGRAIEIDLARLDAAKLGAVLYDLSRRELPPPAPPFVADRLMAELRGAF